MVAQLQARPSADPRSEIDEDIGKAALISRLQAAEEARIQELPDPETRDVKNQIAPGHAGVIVAMFYQALIYWILLRLLRALL